MTQDYILLGTSISLTITTGAFATLGFLKDFRKDGHITRAGRIAVVGALISAVLAIATDFLRRQIQADETATNLESQNRLLKSQEKTLKELRRSIFIFDSVTVFVSVTFAPEELPFSQKGRWDQYLKTVPKIKEGENPDWITHQHRTLVPRPLPILIIKPGSPLYPDQNGPFVVNYFDLLLSRSDGLVAELNQGGPLSLTDLCKIADVCFRLIAGEQVIKYNQQTSEVDLTTTFRNVAPISAKGNLLSILDLPSSTILLISDRHVGACVDITNINVGFERAMIRIGGGTTSLNTNDLERVIVDRRCGATHRFTNDDFAVTKDVLERGAE